MLSGELRNDLQNAKPSEKRQKPIVPESNRQYDSD